MPYFQKSMAYSLPSPDFGRGLGITATRCEVKTRGHRDFAVSPGPLASDQRSDTKNKKRKGFISPLREKYHLCCKYRNTPYRSSSQNAHNRWRWCVTKTECTLPELIHSTSCGIAPGCPHPGAAAVWRHCADNHPPALPADCCDRNFWAFFRSLKFGERVKERCTKDN